jgi:hypothetical protein
LPINDRDIYKVVLERMLGNLEDSGVEAFATATPSVATSAEAAEPANEEPVPDATTEGQLTPG